MFSPASLLLLSMDVEPNPGPQHINISDLPPTTKQFFNQAKRTRLKITRYQSHLDNFLTYKNNNIIPKGLIPKCYPAIHSENPLFWKSWKQNLDTLAITQLDLLIQETYDNITQLNSIFCKQQQQLHTAVGDYSTYRKLTTHLEKMASNLHINLNELRAKKLQNISAISQNENLTALSSCHHTANKACDSEQSQLGSTDNDLLDSSLETMTFVNHKPLI